MYHWIVAIQEFLGDGASVSVAASSAAFSTRASSAGTPLIPRRATWLPGP